MSDINTVMDNISESIDLHENRKMELMPLLSKVMSHNPIEDIQLRSEEMLKQKVYKEGIRMQRNREEPEPEIIEQE